MADKKKKPAAKKKPLKKKKPAKQPKLQSMQRKPWPNRKRQAIFPSSVWVHLPAAAAGNPRRTPIRTKMAIYGWALINVHRKFIFRSNFYESTYNYRLNTVNTPYEKAYIQYIYIKLYYYIQQPKVGLGN